MSLTGKTLRDLRNKAGLSLRETSRLADIDIAIISKIERGERKPTRNQIIKLSKIYDSDTNELITRFLADKVVYELKEEENASSALKIAEREIKYNKIKKISISTIIKKIQNILKKDKRVLKAWLFGSYLGEDYRPESDIDIMLKLNKESFSLFDFAELKHKLEETIHINTDIVEEGCLNIKSETSQYPIMKLIYERSK